MARLLAFIGAALLAAQAGAEPLTLRYGQAYSTLRSIYSLPVVVAEREGFFAREGLDFQVVVPTPGGSDKMIDALYDGTFDITHVATPFLIRKALAGSDAVAIAAEFNNPIYSLVAKPDIKNFDDLKSKTIGFADQGGTISISMRKLLALHGLKDGDYISKVLEGTPARADCLRRGECDAVPLGQPQDMAARAEGFTLLGLSTEASPKFLYTVTAARRSWAQAHKETVVRYLRALRASFKFIRDPTNRIAVAGIVAETTGVSKTIVAEVLMLYFEPERGVLPLEGEIDIDGLAQVIAMMAETGAILPPLPTPEKFVDRQYLRAAGIK
ncbi:MAG TPA: ABC transporter substrate-binding protein [Pseudolabrys sp.]|nr:ABC transporter substrate-binding protein [Pseudolabrys sp.]